MRAVYHRTIPIANRFHRKCDINLEFITLRMCIQIYPHNKYAKRYTLE